MIELVNKELLERYIEEYGSIKIAIAGAGYMSKGLVNQISLMNGIEVVAISSKTIDKVHTLVDKLEGHDVKIFDTIDELAYCDAQVVLDLTGDVEAGARLTEKCILNNKHVMVSAETDATVGPVLNELAIKHNVIYTNMWGDEPGLTKGLYDYADLLGFEIIAIGKFKGFHDPYANPDSVKPWADKSGQNPVVISSFADGSKLSMEMTVISNATGFVADVRGMHMAKGSLEEVCDLLKLEEEGGILSQKGVLEVVLGAQPSGAVFALVRTDNEDIISSFSYYKQGDGPNYMLYIPYHMPGIEMIYGIVELMLLKKAAIKPKGKPVSDAIALAKRDLVPGMTLEAIGGFDYYGEIESATTAHEMKALPLGMAPDALVLRPVKKGQVITCHDVKIQEHDVCIRLRQRFNEMLEGDSDEL